MSIFNKIENLIQESQDILDAMSDVADSTKGIDNGVPVTDIPDVDVSTEDNNPLANGPTPEGVTPEVINEQPPTGHIPAGLLKK